jgi:hypothetical protein
MGRILTTALLSLLTLALPVQGIAAAAMLHCGALHQRMAAAGHDDSPIAHRHVAQSVGAPAHHGIDLAPASANHPRNAPGADDVSTLSGFSCSSCAACCGGVALTGPHHDSPSFAPAVNAPLTALVSAFSGFIPDRPEHPPRFILQ